MDVTKLTKVVQAQPRETAQVKFSDGRIYEAPLWTELRAVCGRGRRGSALALSESSPR